MAGLLFAASFLWSCSTETQHIEPEKPTRLSSIAWSNNDLQSFQYNNVGQVTQYLVQNTSPNAKTGSAKKLLAYFEYDANKLLNKVAFDNGFSIRHYYENNRLKKSEEYDNKNRLALTHTYFCTPKGQLRELITRVHDPRDENNSEIKRLYTYDSRGNVIEENTSVRKLDSEVFYLVSVVRYEGYDQRRSVENLTELSPYLPQISMNVNNPGKRTVIGNDGRTVLSVQTYTYQYNAQGYPTQKTIQTESRDNVPTTKATYEYL